mgnify:CR=1 FL=1
MNQTKVISTPKTCPLYGAHFLRVESRVKGIVLNAQQATMPSLVSCNEKYCQWWSEPKSDCTIIVLTDLLQDVGFNIAVLSETLERIINLLYDKGGK